MTDPVLAVLEYNSIVSGIGALDEMVKCAPVKIIDAITMCPGKYIIVFSGDVASSDYAYNRGIEFAKENLIDSLFLPQIHPNVIPAIGKVVLNDYWDSIGIIETKTVVSGIEAADLAAKSGDVFIVEVRLAIGYGGKSYVKFMGDLNAVEAAMESATIPIRDKGLLINQIIIPQPHIEIKPFIFK